VRARVVSRHFRSHKMFAHIWRQPFIGSGRYFSSESTPHSLNLYEVLGLPRHATDDQIKKAYLAKAKVLHPDVRDTQSAASINEPSFNALRDAYEILSDMGKRASYDRTFKDGIAQPTMSQPSFEQSEVAMKLQNKKKDKAMPMWYVGQSKPTQHQVYYYKQTVAAERAWDNAYNKASRTHKIIPLSRSRSLLYIAAPALVFGIWGINYLLWHETRTKDEDPHAMFRKKLEKTA